MWFGVHHEEQEITSKQEVHSLITSHRPGTERTTAATSASAAASKTSFHTRTTMASPYAAPLKSTIYAGFALTEAKWKSEIETESLPLAKEAH